MTGREVVTPASAVRLGAVVVAFADGLRRRGPLGGPLALTDIQTAVETEGTEVRFRSTYGLTSGTARLSESSGGVTVTYTIGLPGWGALLGGLLAMEVALWAAWTLRGLPFPGGLGVGLVWVLGGMGVSARLGTQFRLRDLLVEAVRTAQNAPAPTD